MTVYAFVTVFRASVRSLLRPNDNLALEINRSRERIRRVVLSASSAILAKALGMASTLLTIPLTAPYLGPERFGLFMTLGSIPLLMSFSDFGMGNGLLTELAKANGRDDTAEVSSLVSSAFFVLLAISLLTILTGAFLCLWIPWASLLGVTSDVGSRQAAPALFVFVACTAISMPIGVVQRVQQGFQESYATNLWLALGNLISLATLLYAIHLRLSLPWLVGAIAGGPVASGIANWIVEFSRVRPWLAPKARLIKLSAVKLICRTGLMMFSSQIGAAVLLSCPTFLLAHANGSATAAPFSILQRLYSVFVVGSAMLITPLWPAYSEAHERGDVKWVRATFFRSIAVNTVLVGIPLMLMALSAPRLTYTISKATITATVPLGIATALMCFLMATRHCVSMMVNGCGYLRNTAIAFPLGALLALSYGLIPSHPVADYFVPLWVSGSECVVLCGLMLDVSRVLRSQCEPSLLLGPKVSA